MDLARWADLDPAEAYLRMRERWRPGERQDLYDEAFRARVDPESTASTYRDAPVAWRSGRLVDGALTLDLIHNLPDGLLMKVERMGLPHGVACRSPFLDRGFVEWAARLDARCLLRGRSGKHLLRRAATALLPRDVAFVRKHGLLVPTRRWLQGPLRDLLEQALSPSLIAKQGIFRQEPMRRLKESFDAGGADPRVAGQVWQLVVFQTWWLRIVA